jgi:hypothetical protein
LKFLQIGADDGWPLVGGLVILFVINPVETISFVFNLWDKPSYCHWLGCKRRHGENIQQQWQDMCKMCIFCAGCAQIRRENFMGVWQQFLARQNKMTD